MRAVVALLLFLIGVAALAAPAPDLRLPRAAYAPRGLTLRGHAKNVSAIAFSPDGRMLASASWDGTLMLWDVGTGKARGALKGHEGWVDCLAFSPDGKTIASGGTDMTVRLWGAAPGSGHRALTDLEGPVRSLAFSPDGLTLVVGSEGRPQPFNVRPAFGKLELWDVKAGRPRLLLEGPPGLVASVAFSPDGLAVASGEEGFGARLWDTAGGKVRASFVGHEGFVGCLAFGARGEVLATAGCDKTIRLWGLPGGKVQAVLKGHTQQVHGIALTGNGRWLASASADRTIKLWDLKTGKAAAKIEQESPVWAVAFSRDGRALAAAVASTIKLWDAASLTQPRANKE